MPHTKRNFVMAYIALVVLPLAGLAGILRVGRSLAAPPSVDGVWSLQLDAAQLETLPCGKNLAATPDKAITISQSGRSFTLNFANEPKVGGSGVIVDGMLHASFTPSPDWAAENGCGNARILTLLATVDAKAKPRSMTGMLTVEDCSTCGSVEFHAAQKSAPPSSGAH
jgi:hypothetical protein